jgi:uncharacterized protein
VIVLARWPSPRAMIGTPLAHPERFGADGCRPESRSRRPAAAWALTVALALFAALAPPACGAAAGAWETGADGLLPIPPLTARVTDLTRTLTPVEQQALEAKLADWEARTTNQLAVLLVPTTQPEPIESYSIRVAEAWKIGRKGNDNGVLFVVAKNDRKMRIEVGYGLEGTLTDVTSRRIIAEDVAPLFREGKFAAGIDAGVDRVIGVVAEGKPLPPRAANAAGRAAGGGFDVGTLFIILLLFVTVGGGILRAILGKLPGALVGGGIIGAVAWFVVGSLVIAGVAAIVAFVAMIFFAGGGGIPGRGGGLSSGGWGGGGGGFSGGGGGGFSGGGGSFGGGGASGGW